MLAVTSHLDKHCTNFVHAATINTNRSPAENVRNMG